MAEKENQDYTNSLIEEVKEACYNQITNNSNDSLICLQKDLEEQLKPSIDLKMDKDDYTVELSFSLNYVLVEEILKEYTNYLLDNDWIKSKGIDSDELVNEFIDYKTNFIPCNKCQSLQEYNTIYHCTDYKGYSSTKTGLYNYCQKREE